MASVADDLALADDRAEALGVVARLRVELRPNHRTVTRRRLVTQLRGEAGARQVEGARVAIAENGGGLQGIEEAVACITVLRRDTA